jgi:N-acetylmuramic acid 6-phosphate etherase
VNLDLLSTEQVNPRTVDIDRLDTLGILEKLNDEDQQVASAVRAALPGLARAVDVALERWRRGGRVVLFGAGTSGRLAMLDAAELGPTFGVPSARYLARMAGGAEAFLKAVEGAEDDPAAGAQAAADLTTDDVAFGIAASGRTPWVLGALDAARGRGASTIGLACVPRPAMADHVDVLIAVDTGPEPISGSTRMKAGTAQKLVLNSFSTALMIRLGKVFSNLMVDVQATNEKLRRRAVRLVELAAGVDSATATDTLARANGDVKTAIAALRLECSVDEARRRLDAARGSLRGVINDADPTRPAANRPVR